MITCQVESFEAALPELKAIFPVHWRELGMWRDRMPLAPQFSEYVRREMDGRLFLATVRRDGKIAAYYVAQVAPGFHYADTLTGTMDMMYVIPEQRQRGLCKPLLDHVQAELSRRGVQIWYSGYKTQNPLGMDRLHDLYGFGPADTYRSKWLGATP